MIFFYDERRYCLCGCSVNKFVKRYAILGLLINIGSIMYLWWEVESNPMTKELRFKTETSFVVIPIKFAVLCMLIYGNMKKNPRYYIPALCYLPFSCIVEVLTCVYNCFLCFLFITSEPDRDRLEKTLPYRPADMIFVYTFIDIMTALINIYITKIVYRSYVLVKEHEDYGGIPVIRIEGDFLQNLQIRPSRSQNQRGAPRNQRERPRNQGEETQSMQDGDSSDVTGHQSENLPPPYNEFWNQEDHVQGEAPPPPYSQEKAVYNQCQVLPIMFNRPKKKSNGGEDSIARGTRAIMSLFN